MALPDGTFQDRDRVTRALSGRDWPGTIVGGPYSDTEGPRLAWVVFDTGSKAGVPVDQLRHLPADEAPRRG